jgi:hypothetical protein
VKEKTGSAVSDVGLEHCGERRAEINISTSRIGLEKEL